MKRLITIAANHPWLIFAAVALISLVAVYQLPALQIEITAEGMMVDNPQAVADYEESLRTFGSDVITVVYLEDPNLLHPDKLSAIRQALRRIEAIPQVSRTTSLFSMRYLRTESGFVHTSPYLDPIPKSHAQIQKLANAALLNPLIERNLLSHDGTVMAINLYLDMSAYQRGFDEEVSAALDEAIAPLQNQLRTVFHLGDPSIRSDISEQIRNDLKLILPLALLVLTLTLWLIFKRSCTAMIPILTAALSVVWTLGVMAVVGIPINVMTSIIPALLIIIGSTEDIHLISEYQAGIQRGLNRNDATQLMANHMGTAILLTAFTTCLGFLSISLNRIDLLQQFGLITAIGLMLNFIITTTMVPACLQCISRHGYSGVRTQEIGFTSLVERIFILLSRYPRQLLLGLISLVLLSGYWASRLEINNSIMAYFPASSSLPGQAALIDDRLSGIQSLTILINGSDEAFLKTANLQQLQKLQGYLEQTVEFEKSFSFADFIAVVHSGIDGEMADRIYLPESDELISGYMSLLGHSAARPFVSADYNQARIMVRHSVDSSKQLNQAVQNILNFAHQTMHPTLKVKVTGSSYLNSQAVDSLADGQTRSLIMMLGIIFILITLILANAKLGFVAVLSNLFPIIVLFGVMGYFNITMDTSSVMVAAIALGICVDHSMHFMVRYQRIIKQGKHQQEAQLQTMHQESLPIFTTAMALTLGFATLAFSTFPPVAQFGLLSAMVMLLALIGIFFVTPLLLRLTANRESRPFLSDIIKQRHFAKAD
ncbi:efflux RND transporter permease subunit [Candidatus Thiodiazotropha sp. CDECU1]|uniref:efflux RND transporter permease subunit n=1 Tax=Candidatus Thiodiazotropha sp. CDECU1 TaxID=3065865 RepID=UPI00293090F5|nr:MMPL family transporter [Candidatus Thiodiazotropha sp. CDECU1]